MNSLEALGWVSFVLWAWYTVACYLQSREGYQSLPWYASAIVVALLLLGVNALFYIGHFLFQHLRFI